MKSANHSHPQDQIAESSTSLGTPSWYATANNNHAWTPNTITTLSATHHLYQNLNEDPYISRVYSREKDGVPVPPFNHSVTHDLGFNWTSNSAESLQLGKIETEDSFPKFTDMMNSSSNLNDLQLPPISCMRDEQKEWTDLSEKLLLKTISSSNFLAKSHYQFPGVEFSSDGQNCSSYGGVPIPIRGNFSHILPSVNISNLNQSSSAASSSLDVNALDLLTSARYSGTHIQSSHDNLGLADESLSFSQQHMQEQRPRPPNSPSQVLSPFVNGVGEEKRSSNNMIERKASQAASKKSRLDSISRKPLKVRKEKLGDRITALQQLVAPFGKTDTASVLMEAIGYIKFLQNQVETLSVPYMKTSHSRTTRSTHVGRITTEEEQNEIRKADLRSRGLCLVPLSCMSYVNTDGCNDQSVWPPNDYGG